MPRSLSGVYTTINASFNPIGGANFGAIGVVGHMHTSGSSTSITGTNLWSSSQTGRVYEFNSLSEASANLGTYSGSTWTSGTDIEDGGGTGSGAFCSHYSLMRALELIYTANPGAKTYVAVLSGTLSDAQSVPDGASEALTALLKEDDVSFVHLAGVVPNATTINHAITASNDTNQSERISVAGLDMANVLSGTTIDVSGFTSLKDDEGRAVVFIGNTRYAFTAESQSPKRNVGGNYLAAYLMGYMSLNAVNVSPLRKSAGILGQDIRDAGDVRFKWSNSQMVSLVDNNFMLIRSQGGNVFYESGETFSSNTSDYQDIITRRIVDKIARRIRASLLGFLGKNITADLLTSMDSVGNSVIIDEQNKGNILAGGSVKAYVLEGDIENRTVRVTVSIQPVFSLKVLEVTLNLSSGTVAV